MATEPIPDTLLRRRIVIEAVEPELDCGRYAIKRELGDTLDVWADIFRDGHDALAAAVRYRHEDDPTWWETRMRFVDNDRWHATFRLDRLGRWLYTIVAWTDAFGSWIDALRKKFDDGQDVTVDLHDGLALLDDAIGRAQGRDRERLTAFRAEIADPAALLADRVAAALDPELLALVERYPERRHETLYDRVLAVQVERVAARFAAWYELFPRSMSDDPRRHGTFDDVIRKLPYIKAMGFDVLYFPPIHPIGRTHRKGRNNALVAGPDDPGSPYAIGAAEGGHTAVHPELGTLEDFRRLVRAAAEHGLEIALDFAIQASPDHPWVHEHPEWFRRRSDGSIAYAENPPKRYEDIYPFDFDSPAAAALWEAWRDVLEFWIAQGVRIFRVDNPHTKPVPFWRWLIREIQRAHPDVIFLAEAFTRPKMMKALAKVGFSQSYTYFTWRNTKAELEAYFAELTRTAMREYFRPMLFPNTPDILPEFLQRGGRPAFLIRAILAATLSSLWGIYSGFELCENRGLPGREEYADSEKYELKAWDWDRPGHIRAEIARLNAVRRAHPALQEFANLEFLRAEDDEVLAYAKRTPDGGETIVVVVSLDPFGPRTADVHLPLAAWGLPLQATWEVDELLWGGARRHVGPVVRVELTPDRPGQIWRVHVPRHSEREFPAYDEPAVLPVPSLPPQPVGS